MRSMEFSGKSVDEAIFRGLQEMEIAIDEVDIEIVQNETKGVFGIGAKPAKVKLTEKPPERILEETRMMERAVQSREQQSRPMGNRSRDNRPRDSRPRDSRPQDSRPMDNRPADSVESSDGSRQPQAGAAAYERPAVRESRGQRENRLMREQQGGAQSYERRPREQRPARDAGDNRPPRQPREQREPREPREPRTPRVEYNYTLEAAEGNPAAEFLSKMLDNMGVKAKVLACVTEDGSLRLRIDSESMGVLIGYRGETLDAMQYLTSLVVNRSRKDDGYTRITLDTEDYRGKREETLERLARKVAAQVRTSGQARRLEPMNPYERRVLHSTLQNNPYVVTHSEGEEPCRRVVISPKR